MMRVRKGEMCVGREKRTGNMPSRTVLSSSHRAVRQSKFANDPWAGAMLASCCPLRAWAQQTKPLPRLLKHLLDPLRWLAARTSSQATLHCEPVQLPQVWHRPKITALKQTWHNYNWVYFQSLKLLISLLWVSLFLCRVCSGWVNGYSQVWDKLSLGLSFVEGCSDKPQTSLAPAKPSSLGRSSFPARERQNKCFLRRSPHPSSTQQKTGRNYGVSPRDINRGFYHLFSLQLLPSCRKFAQIPEGRTQTSHINCPLMSVPYVTQQKPAPISSTVLSLKPTLPSFFLLWIFPVSPTFLSKRFESFLPAPDVRVMAVAQPMKQWSIAQSLTLLIALKNTCLSRLHCSSHSGKHI